MQKFKYCWNGMVEVGRHGTVRALKYSEKAIFKSHPVVRQIGEL